MVGNNGSLARSSNQPNLKSPIPLIHRPLSNPLTAVERANYRLRKEITIGNISYEFFYAKLVNFPSSSLSVQKITSIENDIRETISLNSATNNSDVLIQNEVIAISVPVQLEYTSSDQTHIAAACAILGISAEIKEFGLILGEEVVAGLGVTELNKAILMSGAALDNQSLVPPGITLNMGMMGGVSL